MLNRRNFLKMIAGTGIIVGFPSSLSAFQGLIRNFGKPQTEPKPAAFPYFWNDGNFFYLIGNLEDNDFIKARKAILSTDPLYLWSIAITDSNHCRLSLQGRKVLYSCLRICPGIAAIYSAAISACCFLQNSS